MSSGSQWRGEYAAQIGTEQVKTDETFRVVDPTTGDEIASVTESKVEGVDRAIRAAEGALDEWQALDASERGRRLFEFADLVAEHGERLAEIETAETGRPISHSRVWATKRVPDYIEYFAGLADKVEGQTIPVDGDDFDYTIREPLGITAHVVPWNASLLLGIRSIAPALATGNAVVVKPSPEAPLSILELGKLVAEADFPDGIFSVVPGDGRRTGAALTTDERVDEITFTGSLATGKQIMKAAAEHVTPVSLELGGKSPALVFPDADLEKAAADTVKVFWNAGQICFATTRVFVHTDVYDEFIDLLITEAEAMEVGPGVEDPDIGPLITEEARDRVVEYVENARNDGARIHTGGEIPRDDGYYYAPTIVDGVADDAPISCEEVFGPVLATYEFETESEAIHRANDTKYGLYATVWSNDVNRVHRLARQIEASSVSVNQFPAVSNRVPIGGHKQSGIGRVNGQQAMDTYTEVKSVLVNVGADVIQ